MKSSSLNFLPPSWRQPSGIGLVASVGFHAVVFGGLALMPAGGQPEAGDLRLVGLVNTPAATPGPDPNAPPPGLDFSDFAFPPIGDLPEVPDLPPSPPSQSFWSFAPPSVTTPPRQSFPTMPLPSQGSRTVPPSRSSSLPPSLPSNPSLPSTGLPSTPTPRDYEFGDPDTLPTLESPFALNPPQLPPGLGQPLPNVPSNGGASSPPSQPDDPLGNSPSGFPMGESAAYQASVLLNDWIRKSRETYDPQLLPEAVELEVAYPIAACADRLEGAAKVAALYNQNGQLATSQADVAAAEQQYAFDVNRNPVFIQSSGQQVLDDALLARVKAFEPDATGYYQARLFQVEFQYNQEICQKAEAAGLTSGSSQSSEPAATEAAPRGEAPTPDASEPRQSEAPTSGGAEARPQPQGSSAADLLPQEPILRPVPPMMEEPEVDPNAEAVASPSDVTNNAEPETDDTPEPPALE